jgi:hypothetical protein
MNCRSGVALIGFGTLCERNQTAATHKGNHEISADSVSKAVQTRQISGLTKKPGILLLATVYGHRLFIIFPL